MIVSHHHPVLGTLVEIFVGVDDPDLAREVDHVVVSEMVRLEKIFSIFDEDSELSRWKRAEVTMCSPELRRALTEAIAWETSSDGAFTLSSKTWAKLANEAHSNPEASLESVQGEVARLMAIRRVEIVDGEPTRVGDVSDLDLNAFAKGWIVDRAVEHAIDQWPHLDLTVNAGGDLRRVSTSPLVVALENPLRPYDNEPPIACLELVSGGIATSGPSRRSVKVGEHSVSHIIDPRTGRPAAGHGSVTVTAPDAATADVLATICYLDSTERALQRAAQHGCGCVVVGLEGRISHNALVVVT